MGHKMIHTYLKDRCCLGPSRIRESQEFMTNLIRSRNLFSVQTVEYDLMTVTSLDIDETNNFMLVGLSNGSVDLQEIDDPTFGTSGQLARFNFGQYNVNRVQWNPGASEQFFSILDNHVLHIVDPIEMRALDKYEFDMKTNWSEWNQNDRKIIAICGSESQVRLVDIASGSSAQTVILGAPSGLSSHRATRCLWSRHDTSCLIVGDNEGYLHVYDTRRTTRPLTLAGEERGQISGMSFTTDQCSIITSQGTENHLVEWTYNKCRLQANSKKFKKRKREVNINPDSNSCGSRSGAVSKGLEGESTKKIASKQASNGRLKKRSLPLPVSAYIRCQFHVTDGHIFCPVPPSTRKSKEIYVYDLKTGDRIKTVRSNDILSQGIYSVSSLLPESLVIYVGGRGRLRAWTIDEGYQRKLEAKTIEYHRTRWDSDDEA
jgi:WD40 repeat protein